MDSYPAYDYAHDPDSLDYLYDFFDEDLADRVRAGREFVPEGLEDVLGDNTLEDYVWLWVKEPGPNGFRQYLRDGGFDDIDIKHAFFDCRTEWSMNTLPQLEWLAEDGYEPPEIP